MRSVPDHQTAVRSLICARPSIRVPLTAAAGRVLAEDVVAARPLPAFDNSAMDGYAVRAAEVASAADQPVILLVAADIPAGRIDVPPLAPGTVHRIMTGAPLPEGADAVVQVELTDGGTTVVEIRAGRPAGAHVRRAGEDVAVGERVLSAGTTLGPAQLGLLAALGEPQVLIRPPIRVLVLSTGSELVAPGKPLHHGQIHESNSVMLSTAVRAAGGQADWVHVVADDVAAFHAAVDSRLGDVDLLLTSGGVSAGAYEVVKDALTDHGVDFVKVAMQPGMPQGAGRYAQTSVVTLPGNPVSSMVSFEVFVRPALRAAMGFADVDRPTRRARLSQAIDSPQGKRQYRRGLLDRATDIVAPIGPPASHFLKWLAASNCLLDLPEDVTWLDAGTEVDVWLTD